MMMDNVIIHLSKPVEYTTLRMNPNINDGLRVVMMGQCRFICCANDAVCWQWKRLGWRDGVGRDIWEISVLFTQGCYEYKMALKIRSIFFKS